ncbi:unnamed protein product [Darwinula stevensoni]|uniref:SCP domain-containing protein n=1 Tax=Darwinula stevensoni TaxID=69355 RepID=A0A7R8XDY2_9CRUS|nr:unnamed protein product [Darwinula stevensoni]CAG0893720.1 unnamed protein product [Darwinula stevensoni]
MAPSSEKTFANEVLRLHNDYRARHGSPPLSLSKELNVYSLAWARQLAEWNRMVHRSDEGRKDGKEYGENLFMRKSTDRVPVKANNAVDAWYNEIHLYTFGTKCSEETGHFTQLVWTKSRRLGVARAKSKDGLTWYVVCNYDPPGNVSGYFNETYVPRPLSQTGGKVVSRKVDFKRGMLEQHNHHRKNHGAPPLILDKALSKQSQEWAEKLAKEDQGLRHRPGEKLGSCLYQLKNHGCDIIPKEVVDSWYEQLSTFNFRNRERNGPSTGSQVIWKESQRLGLGKALTKDGKTWYVVAHYDPPGNVNGRFSANVLPRQISSITVASPSRSSKSCSCLIL